MALLALGVALAAGTWLLPEAPGYAKVGPQLFPGIVAGGLILLSLMLLKEAILTGFRNAPDGNESAGGINWAAFGWVTGAVVFQMVFIAKLGFILCGAVLFLCVARAFGSRRALRDWLLGLVLAAGVFFLFTQALTLSLPWGDWIPGEPGVEDAAPPADAPVAEAH
jgi:putative tricarboxylic transport membrane protein